MGRQALDNQSRRLSCISRGLFVLLTLSLLIGCKTTEERTKEQSQTQNSLTNFVKTPIDRTKSMKTKVESAQNSVAQQSGQINEGE